MSYYERHIFFCCNQRASADARPCCNASGGSEMREYAKQRVKELNLPANKIRVNQSGCLDRCEEGPCVVVYPEAVWYTYLDKDDVEEIVVEHLLNGRVVERLKI